MTTRRRTAAKGSPTARSVGAGRNDGGHPERAPGAEPVGSTKSAIRDIIRRYHETFERLAR